MVSSISLRLPDQEALLDEAACAQVTDLWRRLGTSVNLGKVALALRRWTGSAERLLEEDKLIDYWIGLESLFTTESRQTIKFRAKERIAGFLGQTAEERTDIYECVGRSYDWPSTIVHGGGHESRRELENKESLTSVTERTRSYLRSALLKILRSDQPLNLNTSRT